MDADRRRPAPELAAKLAAHHSRVHELLGRLRDVADEKDPESCTWGDVGYMAELAARLAELVPCEPCQGTGYATGRTPHHRRDRHDEAAHAPCSTCGGSGHERA